MSSSEITLPLKEGCNVIVKRGWLGKKKASDLLDRIREQVPFGEYRKIFFGKTVDVPRGIFAFGDQCIYTNDEDGDLVVGTGYIYSKDKYLVFSWNVRPSVLSDIIKIPRDCIVPVGMHFNSHIIPSNEDSWVGLMIKELMTEINEQDNLNFNSVLINEYRTGQDSISAHSDKEVVPPNNEVYGLSLGGTRTIHFISKTVKGERHKVDLHHGDLMIMSGDTQEFYTHEIRKQIRNQELRISLTFRNLPV